MTRVHQKAKKREKGTVCFFCASSAEDGRGDQGVRTPEEVPISKLSLSATLLTLFTSPEHARSIEGNLTEEARSRGRIWFWSRLVRTTLALWRKGFSESPLACGGLTVACGAAWFLLLVLAEIDDSPGLFVFGTLLVGFVWVRAGPVRGIYASSAVTFLVGPIATLVFIFTNLPVEGVTDLMLALADGVLAVGPLFLGSVVARWQIVRKVARAD